MYCEVKRLNLTSSSNRENCFSLHVLDSIQVSLSYRKRDKSQQMLQSREREEGGDQHRTRSSQASRTVSQRPNISQSGSIAGSVRHHVAIPLEVGHNIIDERVDFRLICARLPARLIVDAGLPR